MIRAEEWMELAANGKTSREHIPMGYQPTLPEPLLRGGERCLRFFYYRLRLEKDALLLGKPAYLLTFSVGREVLVEFRELPRDEQTLTDGSELLAPEFAERQTEYLRALDDLLQEPISSPEEADGGALETLYRLWLAANPVALARALMESTRREHEHK